MKNNRLRLIAVLFTMLAAGLATRAQQGTVVPAIDVDDGKDDILFIVKLTAKELKMDVVPTTKVEFPGTYRRTTAWLTERSNLPDKLEPGVTYRDIGMTLRISSRFENIDEIVREALGEAPAAATTEKAVPTPNIVSGIKPTTTPSRPKTN